MIEIILRKLSLEHKVYYNERRTYKDNKVYKSYIVSIDGENHEYKNKCDLLFSIKEMIQLAKRLTDKQKKKIIADYIKNQNYRETARMNNVSDDSVRRIVMTNESIKQKLEQKEEQNTQDTLEYIKSQSATKNRIINKLLKAIEEKSENVDMFTNIKDLAMAYGILIDKELKILEIQKSQREVNNGLDKVQQLLDEIQKEAKR